MPLIILFQHQALSISQIYIRWIRSLLLIIFRDFAPSLLGGAFLREDVRQRQRLPPQERRDQSTAFLDLIVRADPVSRLNSLAASTALKDPRLSCFVIHIETSWISWRKASFSTNGSAERIELKLAASTPCGMYITDSALSVIWKQITIAEWK
jgi:hypothetical protein